MLSITFVVGLLFIGMMSKGMELQKELDGYQAKLEQLNEQLEEEAQRTQEIDDRSSKLRRHRHIQVEDPSAV